MNKVLGICLTVLLCAAIAMAGYARAGYYHGGHKAHLGGYAYRPVKYVPHITYRKPVLHHAAPIVYAHKSYSKPYATHYIKPSYHHQVPHYAPVYHSSKPVYILGGHASHGVAYKPAVYGHGLSYGYKGRYHHY